jgi:sulfate permease, SulP family
MGTPDTFEPKTVSVLREGYDLVRFRRDAVAGLTVAIVALPLSMAIAIASGLGPESGLYTAIVGGFLISLLGGSRFQIGGPAGAFIVLVAAIVERHGYDGLLLATLMAGVMMTGFGVLKLGRLINRVPETVIVSFTAGIAVIIFASQLREVFGISIAREPAAFLPKIAALWDAVSTLKPAAVGLSFATVAVIIVLKRLRPTWPGLLIAVVFAALLAVGLDTGVATIGSRYGSVPSSLPFPKLPDVSLARMRVVLPDAIAIAVLGAIESLLSAVVADGMSGRKHRSNVELVAQGAANIGVACFAGMPATGTIARTATNIRAGATSPISGMLHALYLMAFLLMAAPLAAHIPLAALAGVLAVVSWNMVERDEIARLMRAGWPTALVVVATFLTTIIYDLVAGIALGLVLHIATRKLR